MKTDILLILAILVATGLGIMHKALGQEFDPNEIHCVPASEGFELIVTQYSLPEEDRMIKVISVEGDKAVFFGLGQDLISVWEVNHDNQEICRTSSMAGQEQG